MFWFGGLVFPFISDREDFMIVGSIIVSSERVYEVNGVSLHKAIRLEYIKLCNLLLYC